jgi:site-specific recombinase XerD
MTDLQPQPLFDNLQWINTQTCNPHVLAYLQRIGIDDLEAEYLLAQRFLYAYRGSEDTFKSYRREIERLCQWSWLIKQKKIQVLDRHDVETYFDFVQKPPQSWIAYKHSHRFHTDVHGQRIPCADWRPFLLRQQGKQSAQHQARGLSQSAIRAIIAGASTFFTYLQQEQYCDKNPVLLIRQKNQIVQKHQQHRIITPR